MNSKLLMIIGIAMMIEGFLASFYSSLILFPTEPPMMRPLEGLDYTLVVYRQAFLAVGIMGIFVTITGIYFWRKRK